MKINILKYGGFRRNLNGCYIDGKLDKQLTDYDFSDYLISLMEKASGKKIFVKVEEVEEKIAKLMGLSKSFPDTLKEYNSNKWKDSLLVD